MTYAELIQKAYNTGRSRGTSLSLGYFISPDRKSIFCQNPNSRDGVYVGRVTGYSSKHAGYTLIDMSAELETITA